MQRESHKYRKIDWGGIRGRFYLSNRRDEERREVSKQCVVGGGREKEIGETYNSPKIKKKKLLLLFEANPF